MRTATNLTGQPRERECTCGGIQTEYGLAHAAGCRLMPWQPAIEPVEEIVSARPSAQSVEEKAEPAPHGPVSERFMRHHYGPSGYAAPAAQDGAADRQLEPRPDASSRNPQDGSHANCPIGIPHCPRCVELKRAAQDGRDLDALIERLRGAYSTVFERSLAREAAAMIERQAQEIAEMKRERQARNAIDPVTRLHNICDAMAEDRADSPYSQEAWDAQDEAYREKCADLDAALRRAEALHTALREQAIQHGEFNAYCACCGLEWSKFDPNERHDSGCLASPAETKGDDHE